MKATQFDAWVEENPDDYKEMTMTLDSFKEMKMADNTVSKTSRERELEADLALSKKNLEYAKENNKMDGETKAVLAGVITLITFFLLLVWGGFTMSGYMTRQAEETKQVCINTGGSWTQNQFQNYICQK